ncbi:MAG: ParB/RepB/Spo0J family partition protein [Bacteroidales bacterium]|jgi:ParB family chromosome partitioning protein|nr:ParB/RepB/Spo0J family partition protein [Bacteroidales bacterium]MDD2571166.1 ParB/RepB/Spo0J family partition protein [Bacteroidales bacterium]MDD2813508.1 ParB/RepB/Spo0J family partition protein [Bacteroidales bacterium]MDD3812429.1 ParB/RepB/Spo0J family partition protein [Bacteroidales bacterium]MDD3872081.1 ParB/RepB/Spo0J family partition protein [Bacteroidales bacterium]
MTVKKSVLGRGLGALIEDANVKPEAAVNEIAVELIDTNPYQPRTHFDQESLEELAASIRQIGIIQPITVRKSEGNRYQLITGERRLRASVIAGMKTIPAYIRTADDQSMLELALVENVQREDLDPIEVAISYQRLIDECQVTQESVGERVGKKRSTVANYLRLLKLPPEIQLGLRTALLSIGHAKTLISIEDQDTQLAVYRKIIDNNLSVRKIEEIVRSITEASTGKSKKKGEEPTGHQQLQEQLNRYFQVKVSFVRNPNGKGKIVLAFNNDAELEQILGKLDQIKQS